MKNTVEESPYYLMVNYGDFIKIISRSKTVKGLENKLTEIGCNYKEVLNDIYKTESLEEMFANYSNFYVGKVLDEYSKETNIGDVYVSEIISWDWEDDL